MGMFDRGDELDNARFRLIVMCSASPLSAGVNSVGRGSLRHCQAGEEKALAFCGLRRVASIEALAQRVNSPTYVQ